MNASMHHLVVAALCAVLALPAAAQQKVYRCDTNGTVAYSDSPCIGAKVIDASPTQGADKLGGASRKGREVQREEHTSLLDHATRPLHGQSHAKMNATRRRVSLPGRDQQECARLDTQIPMLEAGSGSASGEARARADVDLYKARKQFFDLKC